MRRIVLYMQQTLDGQGADPANTMEWANVTPQTWDFVDELTATCDATVIGRGLYREFLGVWPAAATSDAASPGMRKLARWLRDTEKLVLSRTLEAPDPAWPNTTLVRDAEALRALRDRPGEDLFVAGGIGVAGALARAGLLDELWIHLNPAVIGEGRPLLADPLDLRLLEARPLDSGVVVLHYAVEHEEAR
jgi:dihydrofolate reductase